MNGTTAVSGASLSPGRFADPLWRLRGLADVNGDGNVDLVWHHKTTGAIYVWFMNGTTAIGANYTNPSTFADTRWELVRVADYNSDGKADLLWRYRTTGDLYIWYMNGLNATSVGYLTPARAEQPRLAGGPRVALAWRPALPIREGGSPSGPPRESPGVLRPVLPSELLERRYAALRTSRARAATAAGCTRSA